MNPIESALAAVKMPEPIKECCVVGAHQATMSEPLEDYFDGPQLQAYARAVAEFAVAEDRKQRWKPIAEVPNDGTLVLVYDERYLICRGDDFHQKWLPAYLRNGITACWQPLPRPPEPKP